MKRLFIQLEIQDGERRHNHKVLHSTNANNINFAAERYAASYWGEVAWRSDNWWYQWDGEIAVCVSRVKELTEEEFRILNLYI